MNDIYSTSNTGEALVKTLKIPDELHKRLSKHGSIGDTYADVIGRLLDYYEHKKRECPTCHEFVDIIELVPNPDREGWYIQKLSCGHTGNIRIMDTLVENMSVTDKVEKSTIKARNLRESVDINDKVKSMSIDHRYGQTFRNEE